MFRKNVIAIVLGGAAMIVLLVDRVPTSVHAMTAHGTDKKTLVTVPLDEGMEAVITLDHVTGDMTGYVINRISGQFLIRYRYNVTQDFPQHQGAYLMAAGLADFRGFRSNSRLAGGVVYVSEESSGQICAYALPWDPKFATSNAVEQDLNLIPLDRAQTRFTQPR